MIDKEELTQALKLWFKEGDVFEVRVLDAVTADYRREHVESGYFEYSHIDKVSDAISKLMSYRGVYVTVNPVNPDLLARAVNRLKSAGKTPTTSDVDILERRWLLIDCDAVRPSGVSSSDEEHELAISKAHEIKDGLASLGWQEPIFCDSGNGAQLMYRIELPSNDDNLVQKCLTEIAKCSDDNVNIDLTVHNPARIWRLPGTMNCKGDSIKTRPHRMAKILSKPQELSVTPKQKLLEIVNGVPTKVEENNLEFEKESSFNIDEWIKQYCPDLPPPKPWQGGRKWVFGTCPFNPDHTDKSAVLIEQNSGAIAFTCHHNGCIGNDWQKLRELFEPNCYNKTIQDDSDINIDGILQQPINESAKVSEDIKPWREITNADVKKALTGTLLGDLCDLFAIVADPPLPLEGVLPKSLVVCGAALSEQMPIEHNQGKITNLGEIIGSGPKLAKFKINTGGGQVCNFFSVLAAPSGSGKDIGGLLDQIALKYEWYIGTAGSGEGLAEAYIECPNGILCISELQPWLDAKHWQHRATEFLTFAFNKGFFKQRFSGRSGGGKSRQSDYCYPNIVANVQPDVFEKIAGGIDLDNGFLGRFLFTKMPPFFCDPNVFDADAVLKDMITCIDVFRRKKGVIDVPKNYTHELRDMFIKHAPAELGTCWKRLVNEYYPRFAVILSVLESPSTQGEDVILTADAWERAKVLTLWFFAHAEKLLLTINDADPRTKERENLLRKVFKKIRLLEKGKGVTLRSISRSGIRNTTNKERGDALSELQARGLILEVSSGHYSIIKTPPEWKE